MQKEIHNRLKKFAINIVRLVQDFPRVPGIFRIIDQLVGAGTSPAANAREVQMARSKPEFISCMGIALRELSEAELWLEIVLELGWADTTTLKNYIKECQELKLILSTIILNTKQGQKV